MGNKPPGKQVSAPPVQQQQQTTSQPSERQKGPSRFATAGSQLVGSMPASAATNRSSNIANVESSLPDQPSLQTGQSPSRNSLGSSEKLNVNITRPAPTGTMAKHSVEDFYSSSLSPNAGKSPSRTSENMFARPLAPAKVPQPPLPTSNQSSMPFSHTYPQQQQHTPQTQQRFASTHRAPRGQQHKNISAQIGGRSSGFDADKFKRANANKSSQKQTQTESNSQRTQQAFALDILDETLMDEILQGDDSAL